MTFIDEHCDRFAVALLLRVLNIAESTYYAWRKQTEQPCDRDLVDLGLVTPAELTQAFCDLSGVHPTMMSATPVIRRPDSW